MRPRYRLRTLLLILAVLAAGTGLNLRPYQGSLQHAGEVTNYQGLPLSFVRFWKTPEGTTSDWNLLNLAFNVVLWSGFASLVWAASEYSGNRRRILALVIWMSGVAITVVSAGLLLVAAWSLIVHGAGGFSGWILVFGTLVGGAVGIGTALLGRRLANHALTPTDENSITEVQAND